MSFGGLKLVMRIAIALIGVGAVWMALKVQSVQALWFFTSDLVFVLLFPQLVAALFDRKANLVGSVAAFSVSLVLATGRRRAAVRDPGADPVSGMVAVQDGRGGRRHVLLPAVSRLTHSIRRRGRSIRDRIRSRDQGPANLIPDP